jgi:hypothetical protein
MRSTGYREFGPEFCSFVSLSCVTLDPTGQVTWHIEPVFSKVEALTTPKSLSLFIILFIIPFQTATKAAKWQLILAVVATMKLCAWVRSNELRFFGTNYSIRKESTWLQTTSSIKKQRLIQQNRCYFVMCARSGLTGAEILDMVQTPPRLPMRWRDQRSLRKPPWPGAGHRGRRGFISQIKVSLTHSPISAHLSNCLSFEFAPLSGHTQIAG